MNQDDTLLKDAIQNLRDVLSRVPGGLSGLIRAGADRAQSAINSVASQARGANGQKIQVPPGTNATPTHVVAGLTDGIKDLGSRLAKSLSTSLASVTVRFRADISGLGADWRKAIQGLKTGFAATIASLASKFEKGFDASIGRVISTTGTGLKGLSSLIKTAYFDPKKLASQLSAGFAHFGRSMAGLGSSLSGQAASLGARVRKFGRTSYKSIRSSARKLWRATRLSRRQFGRAAGKAISSFASGGFRAVGRGLSAAVMGGGVRGVAMAFSRGLAGPLGLVTSVATQAAEAMRGFVESTSAGNRNLARYNAGISWAFQSQDRNEYQRDVKLSKAVEATTVSLARSTNAMRDAFSGWDAFVQNAQNRLGGFFGGAMTEVGKKLSGVGGLVDSNMKKFDPNAAMAPAAGAAVVARVDQAITEILNVLKNPAGLLQALNPANVAGAIAAGQVPGGAWNRIGAAGQNAANAAAQAAAQGPTFADQWAAAMHQMARLGPVRGHKAMPKP